MWFVGVRFFLSVFEAGEEGLKEEVLEDVMVGGFVGVEALEERMLQNFNHSDSTSPRNIIISPCEQLVSHEAPNPIKRCPPQSRLLSRIDHLPLINFRQIAEKLCMNAKGSRVVQVCCVLHHSLIRKRLDDNTNHLLRFTHESTFINESLAFLLSDT